MSKKKSLIEVYTDGSCLKIGGKKKAGYGIHFPNNELPDSGKPFTHLPLTNQRAELYAIYKALKRITEKLEFDNIHVYSDSEYSIKSLTIWIKGWKKNGWKSSTGGPIANQDIITNIDKILEENKGKIKFSHVRAHTGKTDPQSMGNQKADELANIGSRT
jgi:ribonuclease HI